MDDVRYLADHIRKADKREIWLSHHKDPFDAFQEGLENSVSCLTVFKENPIAMFGICPECVLGYKASIWMLGTDKLADIRLPFLKNSKTFIKAYLNRYPYLYNWVHCGNAESLKWLRYCGAKFMPPMPFGIENEYFQYFWFERD